MTAFRVLGVCADDFGLSKGVCQAIVQLVRQGRLTSVSALSGGAFWKTEVAALASEPAVQEGRVEVGLHFNLTEGVPLAATLRRHWPKYPGLGRLIATAHCRALPVNALRDEWRAQWGTFCEYFGRPPDFIDGHQHVHHLPQVREVILGALAGAGASAPAVRSTGHLPGSGYAFKRFMITATGGATLHRRLEQMGLRHNTTLWGCYDFACADYRKLMLQWLQELPKRGALLFCHPGLHDDSLADPIGPARLSEFAYLQSPEFQEDLCSHRVSLGTDWA